MSLAGAEDKLAQIDRQMGSLSIELIQKPEIQRQKGGLS